MKSRNFEILRENHRELAELGGFAEAYVHSDPTSCLVKLRTFAEFLVKALFSHHRLGLTSNQDFLHPVATRFTPADMRRARWIVAASPESKRPVIYYYTKPDF